MLGTNDIIYNVSLVVQRTFKFWKKYLPLDVHSSLEEKN